MVIEAFPGVYQCRLELCLQTRQAASQIAVDGSSKLLYVQRMKWVS